MTARFNPASIAAAVIGIEIAFAATFAFSPWSASVAYADDPDTIRLSDIHHADLLPACAEEDCSDQPDQTGIWTDDDTGNAYLELGEAVTLLIIDDTVGGG